MKQSVRGEQRKYLARLTRIDEDTIEQKGAKHQSQEQPDCLFALLNLYHRLSEVAAR